MSNRISADIQEFYNEAARLRKRMDDPEISASRSKSEKALRGFAFYVRETVSAKDLQQEHLDQVLENLTSAQEKIDSSNKKQALLKHQLSQEAQSIKNTDTLYIDAISTGDMEKSAEIEKTMQELNDNSALVTRQINAHKEASKHLSIELSVWSRLSKAATVSLKRQEVEKQIPALKAAYESFIMLYKEGLSDFKEYCPEKLNALEIPYIQLKAYSSIPKSY